MILIFIFSFSLPYEVQTIHTMEAERPAGGRGRLPRMILWVYARGHHKDRAGG